MLDLLSDGRGGARGARGRVCCLATAGGHGGRRGAAWAGRIWPAVDRIWSHAAAGCNDPSYVVVQGAALRSLPVLLGGGLLTWAKATAPAGAGDGDTRGCRLPPWRHCCHGDFPFEVPGETHVPGLSGTADGGAFRVASFLKASAWWIVWWLLIAGWTVVVARPDCAGVLGEAIRV